MKKSREGFSLWKGGVFCAGTLLSLSLSWAAIYLKISVLIFLVGATLHTLLLCNKRKGYAFADWGPCMVFWSASLYNTHSCFSCGRGQTAHLQFIWGFVWLAAARQLLKSCTEAGKTSELRTQTMLSLDWSIWILKISFGFVFIIFGGVLRCECVETFMMNVRFDIIMSSWWCSSIQIRKTTTTQQSV